MSTLLELRDEVVAHGPDVGPVFTLDDITKYLNHGLRRVARRIDFYSEESAQTITTVAGTAFYAWEADFGRLRWIADGENNRTLTEGSLRTLDELPASDGRPTAYALSGTGFLLYPTPDAAYELTARYWALPALMAADSDVPAIPEDYHELLPFYALKRCYEREDDADMAAYWESRFEAGLREMEGDVKFPSADGPRRIPSAWPAPSNIPRFQVP